MTILQDQETPSVDVPTWKFVLGTIRFRWWYYLFNNLAFNLMTLAWLVPGLITRAVFDLLSGNAPARFDLWTLIALLMGSALVRIGGVMGLVRTNTPFEYHGHALLHKNMLERILEQPGARSMPESPGVAVNRFRGDVGEVPLFALWLNDLCGNALFTAIAVIIMLRINASITLLAFLPLVIIVVAANASTARVEKYRRATREATGKVTGFIAESFGAVQAVKVANAEDRLIEQFNTLNNERRKAALQDRLFSELLNSIFRNAGNVGTGVILLLAARALQAGTFTVGDFSLFVAYLAFISEFVAFIGMMWARYKQAGVAVSRMVRLLQGAPPLNLVKPGPIYMDGEMVVPYTPKTAQHRLAELAVTNLAFRYPASQRGIEDIHFRLTRGKMTVITGRIGSGKTTLVRVLLGLLPKDRGEIRWNGELVEQPADFFTPPRSAYTAQVPRLFNNTLRDNLLMGLPEAQVDLDKAIHAAVMEQDLGNLEKGLDTLVGSKGVKLSGGQVQRAAAARMFVREPELLVFDDLSSALDVDTERLLWERLFARDGEPPTCLVVSHRHTALRRADHIIVLKDGRIEDEGSLAELLVRCEEMQRLWQGDYGKE